jgi:tryptophan synthase beta subunit
VQHSARVGTPVTVVGVAHGDRLTVAIAGAGADVSPASVAAAFDLASFDPTAPPQEMLATFCRLASAAVLAEDLQRILATTRAATGLINILAAAHAINTWFVRWAPGAGHDTDGPIPRLLVGALAELGDEARRALAEEAHG